MPKNAFQKTFASGPTTNHHRFVDTPTEDGHFQGRYGARWIPGKKTHWEMNRSCTSRDEVWFPASLSQCNARAVTT